jgi:hypothetical protein
VQQLVRPQNLFQPTETAHNSSKVFAEKEYTTAPKRWKYHTLQGTITASGNAFVVPVYIQIFQLDRH